MLVIPPHALVLPFTAGTPFLQRWEVAYRGFFYMEHAIWMALIAIHKNTLLCLKTVITFYFLMLTKQA